MHGHMPTCVMLHVVALVCDVVHACCLAAPLFLRLSVDIPRPDFLVGSWQNLKGIYEELNKDGKVLEVEACVVWSRV